MPKTKLQQLHHDIATTICTITPVYSYPELHEKIIDLCELINQEDETDWEHQECDTTLDEIVIGAFWHYTEWHAGQNDITYAALSQLGTIFSPGMTNGCEDESGEKVIYDLMAEMAKKEKQQD